MQARQQRTLRPDYGTRYALDSSSRAYRPGDTSGIAGLCACLLGFCGTIVLVLVMCYAIGRWFPLGWPWG